MKTNTKNLILEQSLLLFSTNGYSGTSVRMIARAVGIKESSLYKHFSSKSNIYDAVVEYCKTHMNSVVTFLNIPDEPDKINDFFFHLSDESFSQMAQQTFDFYLNDPIVSKFRQMLTIDQYISPEKKKLYNDIFINTPIEFQKNLFAVLKSAGFLKIKDEEYAALEFFGPTFTLMAKANDENIDKVKVEINKHIIKFNRRYINTEMDRL